MKFIWMAMFGLCCSCLFACQRHGVELNESLRLSPTALEENIRMADRGDAQAAKKVWHHYEFVEGDMQKADQWKRTYKRLQEK